MDPKGPFGTQTDNNALVNITPEKIPAQMSKYFTLSDVKLRPSGFDTLGLTLPVRYI
jgi:hypothetical protein